MQFLLSSFTVSFKVTLFLHVKKIKRKCEYLFQKLLRYNEQSNKTFAVHFSGELHDDRYLLNADHSVRRLCGTYCSLVQFLEHNCNDICRTYCSLCQLQLKKFPRPRDICRTSFA